MDSSSAPHRTTPSPPQGSDLPVWRQFLQLRRRAFSLWAMLVVLLAVELVSVVAGRWIIPDAAYLRWYLAPGAWESTQDLLHDRGHLMADPDMGWRNRPNARTHNWIIDEHGSRTPHPVSLTPSKPRVVFLGDSMINGGTHMTAEDAISAQLERLAPGVEALNFGTMLYSPDQSLLFFTSRIHRYQPQVLFVGVTVANLNSLVNHYVPFLFPKETNLPFVKPRYMVRDSGVRLRPVQPKKMLAQLDQPAGFLEFLRQGDAYYPDFAAYQRFGLTPLTGGAWSLFLTARGYYDVARPLPQPKLELLHRVARRLEQAAQKQGVQAVHFLALPVLRDHRRGWREHLPDRYGQLIRFMKERGHHIVDLRPVFARMNQPLSQLYFADNTHYLPPANQAIARALVSLLPEGWTRPPKR